MFPGALDLSRFSSASLAVCIDGGLSRRVEGAGSFLRPDAKGLDIEGKTFSEALHAKYLDYSSPSSSQPSTSASPTSQDPQVRAATQRFATDSNFEVEVVLNDRVNERFRQLGRLREVGLEWEGVSCATRSGEKGEEEELRRLGQQLKSTLVSLYHLEEALSIERRSFLDVDHETDLRSHSTDLEVLNLSFSLLPTLEEADRIAAVLPKLRSLALKCVSFLLASSAPPLLTSSPSQLEPLRPRPFANFAGWPRMLDELAAQQHAHAMVRSASGYSSKYAALLTSRSAGPPHLLFIAQPRRPTVRLQPPSTSRRYWTRRPDR